MSINVDKKQFDTSSNNIYEPEKFLVELYTNGTYLFKINNITWLQSSKTWMRANGVVYDSYEKSLNLTETSASSGNDQLGGIFF